MPADAWRAGADERRAAAKDDAAAKAAAMDDKAVDDAPDAADADPDADSDDPIARVGALLRGPFPGATLVNANGGLVTYSVPRSEVRRAGGRSRLARDVVSSPLDDPSLPLPRRRGMRSRHAEIVTSPISECVVSSPLDERSRIPNEPSHPPSDVRPRVPSPNRPPRTTNSPSPRKTSGGVITQIAVSRTLGTASAYASRLVDGGRQGIRAARGA